MSGYIYFIACEPLEAVKIGFTSKAPQARLAALQTGSPAPLKLECFVRGTQDEERRLHRAFEPLNINREWFRSEMKLFDFIAYMQEFDGAEVPRDTFENALHDILMQGGGWYPDSPIADDVYDASGDWRQFHDLLWDAFGPWMEAE